MFITDVQGRVLADMIHHAFGSWDSIWRPVAKLCSRGTQTLCSILGRRHSTRLPACWRQIEEAGTVHV